MFTSVEHNVHCPHPLLFVLPLKAYMRLMKFCSRIVHTKKVASDQKREWRNEEEGMEKRHLLESLYLTRRK